MAYFLISVSNRLNLDLCIQHAQAGFTSSISGAWAFVDIQDGDFISFLYGARAFNLYQVRRKRALLDAGKVPPWSPIRFRSGLTYTFPFRLELEPVRHLEEPLVRAEFAYVAENLLLRGGYRKTQFQADQTTLQAVSQMGNVFTGTAQPIDLSKYPEFALGFTLSPALINLPQVFGLHENILQSLVRQHLDDRANREPLLRALKLEPNLVENFEALGERAFPEGHVDILLKEKTPIGLARQIVLEVKTRTAIMQDIAQIQGYRATIKEECIGAALIAPSFAKRVRETAKEANIAYFTYTFVGLDLSAQVYTFNELKRVLQVAPAD